MSAEIIDFPSTDGDPRILKQQEADDLFDVLTMQGVELHNQLEKLQKCPPDAVMDVIVDDYSTLVSTLLMSLLAQEHRIAVLDQRLLDLESAVFGGEE